MIEKRISDDSVLRLIRKWIQAGVIEEGTLLMSETGTGQGQPISPILANINSVLPNRRMVRGSGEAADEGRSSRDPVRRRCHLVLRPCLFGPRIFRNARIFKDFDWWWNRSLPTQFPAARSKTHFRMTAQVSVVGARIKEHEMGKSFAQNYFRTTSELHQLPLLTGLGLTNAA